MLNTTGTVQEIGKISLVLSYAPLGLVRALSARIGIDSMLVDTGCVTLCDNSEVGIVLSIPNGEHNQTHRIRARVAGNDGDGVKLTFQECDRATLQALLPYVTAH
ncbi:MAG: hypothetical protein OQK94_09945 [Gammaproteobacteria bacterium]|nr:hypothetical protein [Gammaproteobacteria bacterium]MCW8841414.1 hypothetical protein [Gammaproteobacteria bacterium]MCW8927318.1 hypothetical protein [Gammaproteobacteria bacterium]MCW8958075.1 hypothetical protein [Gammaproteobacteria bacterium]MCW8971683.1 hypothetical protein [Gammaproteobacteria bacterium]